MSLDKTHRLIIDKQAEEIQALKDRLTNLEVHVEAREQIMVAEAKAAASAVASAVASQHVAGLAQSLGRLQGRLDPAPARLPRPDRDDD
jgi:hypothetical protein